MQELLTENDNVKDNEGQQEELKLMAKKIKICLVLAFAALIVAGGCVYCLYMEQQNQEEKFFEISSRIDGIEKRVATAEGSLEQFDFIEFVLLKYEVENLKSRVDSHINPPFDFSVSSIQNVGYPFAVCNLSLDPHLAGIKIRGRLINQSSVAYEGATFTIKIEEFRGSDGEILQEAKEKDFWIKAVGPGKSVDFGVFIDEVDPTKCKYGHITFKEGSLSWYKM